MSSVTSTVPHDEALRHFVLASACRAVETAYRKPRTSRRICRTTTPGSNIFEVTSMTAPSVRSGPTIEATSSIVMPFCTPTTRPSGFTTGLMSSQAHRRVVSLDHDDHDIKRLPKRCDFAEMKCANRRYSRFVRHLDPNAGFPHRLDMRRPLIDERDIEAGARHIRAYGRAVRPRAENRDPWTPHLRAPFLFASRRRFVCARRSERQC